MARLLLVRRLAAAAVALAQRLQIKTVEQGYLQRSPERRLLTLAAAVLLVQRRVLVGLVVGVLA